MQVKRVSDQQFGNALEVLKSAKIDKKEKDLALCGLKDSAEDCEKLAAELGTATRDLLRQRVLHGTRLRWPGLRDLPHLLPCAKTPQAL